MKLFCIVLLLSALSSTAQPRQDILLNTNWRATLVDSNHWQTVDIPHNWNDYGDYDNLPHSNLHGSALYTRDVEIKKVYDRRYFLWFEGVGSYATVRVNGQLVGTHSGGLTSFTLDITNAIKDGKAQNIIEVRADHPASIADLPWGCGSCSDTASQPFGIFRSVHLLVTSETRIEPFGVHAWNDTTVNDHKATLFLETEIKNYAGLPTQIELIQTLYDTTGAVIATKQQSVSFTDTTTIRQQFPDIGNPHLWSPDNPYRYTLVTDIMRKGKLIDRSVIGCGIRRIHWADPKTAGPHPFTVNGRPVSVNGVAEDEHRIGNSHAFTLEEIKARVLQIRAAGFNAFHDAHEPHNLYYQHFWDSIGMLWWPQYSTHIWSDTPEFRKNFKQQLIEFIKERRNSPSIILWGLQNESKLPEDFAKECADLIRQLDPTASTQRPIVHYDGDSTLDSAVHFVDYKDLLTEWGEPLDSFYLYKAKFTKAGTDPMVYIVRRPQPTVIVYSNCDTVELFNGPISLGKHTRHGIGNRFQWDSVKTKYPLLKAVAHDKGQEVAMDETDLAAIRGLTHIDTPVKAPRSGVFGKIESLGRKIRNAVPDILTRNDEVISPDKGHNYLYRINCGGPTYTDHDKNVWLADTRYTGGDTRGSITDPIANTVDDSLFRTFRYGLQKLNYTFPVQPGEYRVELYFVEPWLGAGSPKTDCTGWRQFDVAVNDQTVINDLDIWKDAGGRAIALKKVVYVKITGNKLDIHFPKVAAGQGLISAIAIATKDKNQHPAPPSAGADFQKKGDIYALLNPTYQ